MFNYPSYSAYFFNCSYILDSYCSCYVIQIIINQIIQSISQQISKQNMSTPPWVKNNNNNNNTVNQPPPWAKNNSNDTASTPVNNPPWVKSNTTNTTPSTFGQKANIVNTPPIGSNNQPQNSNNTPPWAKNLLNSNTGTSQTNNTNLPIKQPQIKQPPWAKNNNTTNISNIPIKQPEAKLAPWAKQTNSPSNGSMIQSKTITPPWANKNANTATNNQSSVIQPPWAKQNTPQLTEKQPPWMKKQSNSPSSVQGNTYRLQQTAAIQKQKKELQQTIKRQQQQQKQLKRLQKLKKQKQQEQQNIKRQLLEMAKEQQQSILRQKFQKQEIARMLAQQAQRIQRQRIQNQERIKLQQEEKDRLLRQEQQRLLQERRQQERLKLIKQKEEQQTAQKEKSLKLNESQRKSKSKIKSSRRSKKQSQQQQQNSKISQISSIKALEIQIPTQRQKQIPQNQNLFHKYNRLISQQHHESNYKNKIQIQKQIIQLQLKFKRQSEVQIMSIIQKKKITNRKRKFILSNSLQIKYGLCQGKKKDNKISFITSECDELKAKFISYEILNKCICCLLKKKMNIHLRTPLLNLAQYKGIVFLIQYICEQLIDMVQIDITLYQEISNQILILEKQLELYYEESSSLIKPITRSQMLVKKINIYDENYYFIYLKDIAKDPLSQSRKKQNTPTNLNQITFLQSITTPSFILPYYQHPLTIDQQTLENYDIVGSHLKSIAQSIYLASSIHTVYSSCQGQVNESSFFQLVLDENKQVWEMIQNTGYKQPNSLLPLALSYLQKIGSIRFNITKDSIISQKGKKRQLIKSVRPKIYIQRQEFQFLQFIKNTQRYIIQGKQELIDLSMDMNTDLWSKLKEQQQINFIQIKNTISYYLHKKQYQKALQYLSRNKQKISQLDIRNISISLLQIRIFIILNQEIKMINKLTELINLLQFYFKSQTIIHSYIYTIVGTYYSKQQDQNNQERQKNVIIFYQHALNIALKLYGQKSYQIAQIYLNRANAFFNLKLNHLFYKDINQALKLFKIHSKSGSRISQCLYLQGKVQCSQGKIKQGIQNMELSIEAFLKLQNYIQVINIYFSMLQFMQQNEAQYEIKLQRMVQICFIYKCVWAFKRIITLILDKQLNCYSTLTISNIQSIIHQESDEQYRTNEQIMIDLQNFTKGFSSFIQILRWSLSILAAKMIVRRQTSVDYQKAYNIMKNVFHFYVQPNKPNFDFKQSYLI